MPTWFLVVIGGTLLGIVVLWSYWWERRVTRALPPAGEFVDTDGGRLHVIRRSAPGGGGHPIVLLHGSTTNALDMEIDLAGRLEDRHELLIPDRPGHGYSERPRDGWRLDKQVEMVREGLAKLGVERPIVLGQSYGGAVALRYALDYPDEAAGLVLVAPVTHPWPGGISWYAKAGINPRYGWLLRRTFIALYGRFGSPRGVARALRGSHLATRYHARARVDLTFRPTSFRHNNEDVVRLFEQLTAMQGRYREIRLPVECVAGSHDLTVMTSVHARTLEKELSAFNLEVVPGGGHALHHTHPDAVVDAVRRLEARLASSARSPLQDALRRLTSVFPRSA